MFFWNFLWLLLEELREMNVGLGYFRIFMIWNCSDECNGKIDFYGRKWFVFINGIINFFRKEWN